MKIRNSLKSLKSRHRAFRDLSELRIFMAERPACPV